MSHVRAIRESKGLRREDVASRAGISYEYVRRLESDDPPTPGLDIARRVADALDSTIDDLFPSTATLAAPAPDDAA